MEGNAPVYKKVYIPTQGTLGITVLDWLSNSLNSNPIENIWNYIKDITARDYAHISSIEEMKIIVHNMWEQFANDRWDDLIEIISERMAAMIAVQRGSTRY